MRFCLSIISFVVLLLADCSRVSAFVPSEQDSLVAADTTKRAYTMNEVVVTSLRLPNVASLSSSPVTVLTAKEIQNTNSTSLAHLLSSVNGLFVKDYGSNSGLKTIAQRGLGPEHTLVLINGMRASTPQLSLMDLGLFSADEIDRVEILHGGNSASFGSDAVAGVVNILTQPAMNAPTVRAFSSVGSFGYRQFQLSGGVSDESVALRGSYREEKGEENFPFLFRNGNERFDLVRQNSDFLSRSGTLQSSLSITPEVQLSLFPRTYSSERGAGGQVVGPASTSVARQTDKDHLAQLQLNSSSEENLRYRVGIQLHDAYVRYRDELFFVGASSLDNYYRNKDWRVEPSVEYSVGENARIAVGGEFSTTSAEGNSLKNDVRRKTYGAYISIEERIVGETDLISGLLAYPSLRFDGITTERNTISQWSPQFGVVLPFREIAATTVKPTLRASVSRNFAAPTFNQLHFAGGGGIGNPNLQPERSTSFDVGGDVAFDFLGKNLLQASFFNINMQNRIQWVSAGGQTVTPKNIRDVHSRGVELSYRLATLEDVVSVGANYSSTSTTKTSEEFPGDPNINTQLSYVPQETASFSLTLSQSFDSSVFKQFAANVSHSFVGFRYTAEDNKKFLPSYSLTSANVRMRFAIAMLSLNARFEINNLFDKEYQTIISYPMPGRSYKVTLGVEY